MGGQMETGDEDKIRRQQEKERAMIDYQGHDAKCDCYNCQSRHLEFSRTSKKTLCGLDTSGLIPALRVPVEGLKTRGMGMIELVNCPACVDEFEGQIKEDMSRCRALLKEIKEHKEAR